MIFSSCFNAFNSFGSIANTGLLWGGEESGHKDVDVFLAYPQVKTSLNTTAGEKLDDWIVKENQQSVDQQLKDLFSKYDGLNKDSVSKIELKENKDNFQANVGITVKLKGSHIFKSEQGELGLSKTYNTQVNTTLPKLNIRPSVYEPVAKDYFGVTFKANEDEKTMLRIFNFFFNENDYFTQAIASISVKEGSTKTADVQVNLRGGFIFEGGQTSNNFTAPLSKTRIGPAPSLKAVVLGEAVETYTAGGSYTQPDQIENVLMAFFKDPAPYLKNEIASIQVSKAVKDKTDVTITLKSGFTFDDGKTTKTVYKVSLLKAIIAPTIFSSVIKDDVKKYFNQTFTTPKDLNAVNDAFFGSEPEGVMEAIQSIHVYQKEGEDASVYVDMHLKDGYILDTYAAQSYIYETELTASVNPSPKDKIDVGHQTVNAWIKGEQAKELSAQISDLFKTSPVFSAASVKSIKYEYHEDRGGNIKITVTLNNGFVFSDRQTQKSWTVRLTNVTVGTPKIKTSSFDISNHTLGYWVHQEAKKLLSTQLDDLFVYKALLSEKTVKSIDYAKGTDSSVKIIVHLDDQYAFDEQGKKQQNSWILTMTNVRPSIDIPTQITKVAVSGGVKAEQWIDAENRKSVDERFDDVFSGKHAQLSSKNASISLEKVKSDWTETHVKITVTLTGDDVFYDESKTIEWVLILQHTSPH